MILAQIDRSRSTRGGMATSFVLHAALLLVLGLMAGQQAARIDSGEELMEIAYIEARYGEDVAKQVQMKEPPRMRPEPPGRGINTDSAMKAPETASPEAPRPEPRQATPQPKPKMQLPVATPPTPRQTVAQADIAPTVTKAPQKTLAAADRLAAKTPAPKARQVIDSSRLGGSLKNLQTTDVAAPKASLGTQSVGAFAPQQSGLQSRTGEVALGEDVLKGRSSQRGRTDVVDAPAALSSGGGLQPASGSTYNAPAAALTPAGSGSGGSRAVADVDGLAGGAGGGQKSGRKTILNYGSGGGGRGGSLSGRQRIAEPAAKQEIVAQAKADESMPAPAADVKLDGQGVNMTITGQIQGRKILKSVPPQYTELARKKGWEGVVAVHFTVKADGHVKDNLFFEQTSVHRDLNQAAREAIRQFVFAPLGPDQAAVEQWGVITIVFRLN